LNIGRTCVILYVGKLIYRRPHMANAVKEKEVVVQMDNQMVPWHRVGRSIESSPDAQTAIKFAHLDWRVIQEKVYTRDGVEIPNLVANIRESDRKFLGIVTKRYRIVQNEEAFEFTNHIIRNELGANAQYDSAGSIMGGRKVWLSMKLDPKKILGEAITPYIIFTNSHDGKGSVKVAITPIRVLCSNTLLAAFRSAQRTWEIRHVGNINRGLEEAELILLNTSQYMEEFSNVANEMSRIKLFDKSVSNILETLYPLPEDDGKENDQVSKLQRERIISMRDTVLDLYKNRPDLQNFRGTAWGLYNAIADFESHYIPFKKSKTYQEKRIARFIDGGSRIEKAQELLLAS